KFFKRTVGALKKKGGRALKSLCWRARSARRYRIMDEFLQSSPPASGDEQPVSHGGMACRHGQDRGGEDCGYAASLGQRKRVAHIPTADAKAAAGSCLIDVVAGPAVIALRRPAVD